MSKKFQREQQVVNPQTTEDVKESEKAHTPTQKRLNLDQDNSENLFDVEDDKEEDRK